GVLAGLGLTLAALGLYGVMAYTVGQRTGEMGLRMALGARPRDIVGLVVGQGARLIAAGLATGLVAALALARTLGTSLYQVSPADPGTFARVGILLVSVGLAACGLPAWRATRIDPMTALRRE